MSRIVAASYTLRRHIKEMQTALQKLSDYIDELENGETPVEQLDLSIRAFNALQRNGIYTIKQLSGQLQDEQKFLSLRGIGPSALDEIKALMLLKGYTEE